MYASGSGGGSHPSSSDPPMNGGTTAWVSPASPDLRSDAANNNNHNNTQSPNHHAFAMTRTVAHYERLEQIGEGTYGQVYQARCRETQKLVALKKMRISHGGYFGMPLQFIREIKILKRLQHPNILDLIEVVTSKGVEELDDDDPPVKVVASSNNNNNNAETDRTSDAREGYKGNLFLVLEYVSHDLTGLLDVGYQFAPVQIKCIVQQLLRALEYMHQEGYVHRDIKSSNILLDGNFRLKLADFGLARSLEPGLFDALGNGSSSSENSQMLTNKVITLWYRPPEILVGAHNYGPAVDNWSAGCILAELLLGKPLFAGKSETEQFRLIVELLGTPTPETWDYLKTYKKVRSGEVSLDMAKTKPCKLQSKYSKRLADHSHALGLLEKLLIWDPRRRWTSAHALEHRYFRAQPVAPADPRMLGTLDVGRDGHFHEFQTKQQRRAAKKQAEEARQKARLGGASEPDALEEFDRVYRALMKEAADSGMANTNTKNDKDGNNDANNNNTGSTVVDRKELERRHQLWLSVMRKYDPHAARRDDANTMTTRNIEEEYESEYKSKRRSSSSRHHRPDADRGDGSRDHHHDRGDGSRDHHDRGDGSRDHHDRGDGSRDHHHDRGDGSRDHYHDRDDDGHPPRRQRHRDDDDDDGDGEHKDDHHRDAKFGDGGGGDRNKRRRNKDRKKSRKKSRREYDEQHHHHQHDYDDRREGGGRGPDDRRRFDEPPPSSRREPQQPHREHHHHADTGDADHRRRSEHRGRGGGDDRRNFRRDDDDRRRFEDRRDEPRSMRPEDRPPGRDNDRRRPDLGRDGNDRHRSDGPPPATNNSREHYGPGGGSRNAPPESGRYGPSDGPPPRNAEGGRFRREAGPPNEPGRRSGGPPPREERWRDDRRDRREHDRGGPPLPRSGMDGPPPHRGDDRRPDRRKGGGGGPPPRNERFRDDGPRDRGGRPPEDGPPRRDRRRDDGNHYGQGNGRDGPGEGRHFHDRDRQRDGGGGGGDRRGREDDRNGPNNNRRDRPRLR